MYFLCQRCAAAHQQTSCSSWDSKGTHRRLYSSVKATCGTRLAVPWRKEDMPTAQRARTVERAESRVQIL